MCIQSTLPPSHSTVVRFPNCKGLFTHVWPCQQSYMWYRVQKQTVEFIIRSYDKATFCVGMHTHTHHTCIHRQKKTDDILTTVVFLFYFASSSSREIVIHSLSVSFTLFRRLLSCSKINIAFELESSSRAQFCK